jgi:hypothetical protein
MKGRNLGLLAALSSMLIGTNDAFARNENVQKHANGHRSSTGSTARNTGPVAKRAEKARRRMTRRAR